MTAPRYGGGGRSLSQVWARVQPEASRAGRESSGLYKTSKWNQGHERREGAIRERGQENGAGAGKREPREQESAWLNCRLI